MSNERIVELDWAMLLAFDQAEHERIIAPDGDKVGAKIGAKIGVKGDIQAGAKIGAKIGVKVGAKPGIKGPPPTE